jgi:solute carrier family 25 (mitochondrial oxoglutarate transporter), member 11
LSIAKEIYKEGGVGRFYRGIDSALMRQALYTTTRLGIYFSLSDYLKYTVNGGENMTGF